MVQAIDILADRGPALGRPLVDHVEHSSVQNLKELRPGSAGRSELRVVFVFDPWRSAILLVAGDKSGNWKQWYREAIPRAEQLLETCLKERAGDEGGVMAHTRWSDIGEEHIERVGREEFEAGKEQALAEGRG